MAMICVYNMYKVLSLSSQPVTLLNAVPHTGPYFT